ncbi:MAG TPA: phosphate signaling complex protein PhoU [Allosphingosinicella sp.]|nr:phosphate signaling complex protein PhoU [Allosphingosinicella sp.]
MATTGNTQTLKAFDRELDELRALISQMGGLAEHAIRESMRALMQRDLAGAAAVVEEDRKLDQLEAETERRVVQLIARGAPMAEDLHEAIAALKIVGVVERIGDYAKNIAKRVPQLGDARDRIEPVSLLPEMARIAAEMVHDVLDAFVERDAEKARAVCARDRAVDDFYNSIFRALLTFMMEDPANITPSTHLLFVAKNIERIGDHATNIAEMVWFAATGERLTDRQRGADPLTQS